MKSKVLKFLPQREKPYLLALSGGADSMALFHLMLMEGVYFHAMTIDHGWRKESEQEIQALRAMCEKKGVAFFSEKIEGFDFSKSNIEDRLRVERYHLLTARSKDYDSIVTGHHKDDCIETTLKRLFEGARLTHLYGMRSRTNGILRPLIDVTKSEILAWLEEHDIPYFHDITNDDQTFLRARMRHTLIPLIEEHFGKKLSENLALLSERSHELKEYLDQRITPHIEAFNSGFLDLSQSIELVELKHLLSTIVTQKGETLNRAQLATLISMIEKGISNKKLQVGKLLITYRKKKLEFQLLEKNGMLIT